MSFIRASAWSHLLSISFTRTPSKRDTHFLSKTASIGIIDSKSLEISERSSPSRTPAVRAASSTLGEIGSQPPKTRSSNSAKGTKSLINGFRPSSFVPRRIWAIWLIDPIGGFNPFLAARTPAMKVEATAPIPGVRMPSLPLDDLMFLEVMN